jgi:hypothetical protein
MNPVVFHTATQESALAVIYELTKRFNNLFSYQLLWWPF